MRSGAGLVSEDFKKWQCFESVKADLEERRTKGTWTMAVLTVTQLIEIFQGKSVRHKNYQKTFPKIERFPRMKMWLEKAENAPSDLEIWGQTKGSYNFSDLKKYMDTPEPIPQPVASGSTKRKVRASSDAASAEPSRI